MIISLRGTNGSGKTTVVRNLMEMAHTKRPHYGVLGIRAPEAYTCEIPDLQRPLCVIGPYQTPTGGCDNLIPFLMIPALINKYRTRGHVLFEGVIVGSIWGQVGSLLEDLRDETYLIFLSTPLEQCLANVRSRRADRRERRVFNPQNTEYKFGATLRVRERAVERGYPPLLDVTSEEGAGAILELLRRSEE
jgi:hypothetical protein